ncbi:MAG TPA: TonB-dependent receptor [Rhizomicrobium sp.]|nr:TonB-dependent receptor [Rhizomicrobium sp.]
MFQIQSKSSLKTALLLGAATASAIGFSAAASAADDTTKVETVVVTGSRIPQQGLYSSSPVTSVGQREMKFEGTTSIDTLVSSLPSATADFNAVASAFSGALGTANVDLRSLGAARTLVLIDGKRLMPGDPILPVADLNQIPASLVDHVEVLTGGASAIYGSDAIAGVVNFVMRKDFEGVEVDATYGINNNSNDNSTHGHTLASLDAAIGTPPVEQDWWGGSTADATVIFGANADNGKGNITAWLGYRDVKPVNGNELDYSNCTLGTNFVDHLSCQGSSNLNRWISLDNLVGGTPQSQWDNFETGTGTPGSGAFVPYTGAASQKFNFGAPAYVQQPSVRYTAGFDAHYEVAPWATVYSNLMFADNESTTLLSPTAVFLGSGPANFPGTISPGYVQINCSNPLMSLQQNQRLCGLLPGDALVGGRWNGGGNVTPGLSLLQIGRRDVEDAGRVNDTHHSSYRFVIGVKGDIADGWTYDAFAQYGLSLFNFELTHEWSKQRVENALNVDPATGQCFAAENNSDPKCVPLDIFDGFGGISPAASNYIAFRGFQTGYTQEQVVGGSVTGDLGKYGVQSPWAKDPVSLAFGTEYRAEYLRFNVDTGTAGGDAYGTGAALEVPRSGFDVKEGYFEVRIPIVQGMPFFHDLTVNGGYRYSDYSTVGGIDSYKYGLEWAPTEDVRFRASIDRATRAPNVLEVFSPNNVVLFSGQDPCATSTAGQCAGVTNAGNANLLSCPATQCNRGSGGNASLLAETADTKTFGVVFTPTFIDGLTATVDYYNINVANYVGTYGAQTILNGCYQPGASAAAIALYCPLVHRSGTGAIYGAGFVTDINHNLPFLKTSGIDFEANYNADFDDWGLTGWGSLSSNFIGTYTMKLATSPSAVSDPASFDCAGLFGTTCGSPTPTWKHKMRVTWSTPWDVDISLQWRHISQVALDADTTDPLLGGSATTVCPGGATIHGAGDCVDQNIRAYDYFDLSGVWNVTEGIELRAGINNLFDIEPPILDQGSLGVTPIPFGAANTFPGTYDPLGRNVFIAGTIKL